MSTTDALNVGIKLLGLYLLCLAFKDVPVAIGAIGLTVGGETEDPFGVLVLYLISALIVLVFGLLLCLKTSLVQEILSKEKSKPKNQYPFTMGGALKLSGVFLAVTSFAQCIGNVGVAIANDTSLLVKVSLYGPDIFTCVLGVLLAIKGQYIWSFISE